ncbi:class I SAM-dependent methyltransferase [Actinokineospora sp.]|uniref:class I SAM-dependent methyltransferase n=1 Tax=Actinokineospora sp. TaxID=1872133 RepID=UPI00403781AD
MDEVDMFARRASSFGANATAYAEHRPDYPAAAIEWIVGDRTRVLDLGAGTGKLTGGLLALGLEVAAVEPDAAMLAELTRRYPDVPALNGTADHIPLADASVDAVVAGQAFHWFATPGALAEITRVLRPGGVFGALWNRDDDRVPWVAGLVKVAANSMMAASTDGRQLPEHELLLPYEEIEVPHVQRRTVESLLATIGTHSQVAVLPEVERKELDTRVRDYLYSRPETVAGTFDRPLLTMAVRAVRR